MGVWKLLLLCIFFSVFIAFIVSHIHLVFFYIVGFYSLSSTFFIILSYYRHKNGNLFDACFWPVQFTTHYLMTRLIRSCSEPRTNVGYWTPSQFSFLAIILPASPLTWQSVINNYWLPPLQSSANGQPRILIMAVDNSAEAT